MFITIASSENPERLGDYRLLTTIPGQLGNSAGFHAARQDAQLSRLTVHWLSVTRATEGPLSEISGPYFSLAPAAIDIGHVDSLDGRL